MPIPIFGPRLDAGDAVGTDGRPRWRSLLVATVLVVGFFGVIALALQAVALVTTATTSAGLVAVAVALLNREDDARQIIAGHALLLPAALLATLGLVSALRYPIGSLVPAMLGLLAVVELTAFALAATWANTLGDGTMTYAVGRGWLTIAMTVVLLVVGTVVGLLAWASWQAVAGGGPSVLGATTPGLHLTWTMGLLALAGLSAWAALGRLPVVQLTRADRRDRVRRRVDRLRTALLVAGIAGLFGAWSFGMADVFGFTDRLLAVFPAGLERVLGAVSGTPVVRVPLAVVALVAALLTAGAWAVRRLSLGLSQARTTVGPLVGAATLSLFVVAIAGVATGRAGGGPGQFAVASILMLLLVLAVVSLFMTLATGLPLLAGMGVVPDRGAAPALTSAGVFLVALFVGLGRGPTWLVVGGVALSLVVWDVAEFARGLTEELGRRPDTRRIEAVHGVGAVGLGALALGVAAGLDAVVRAVPSPDGVSLAMAFAALALVAFLAALRA